MGIKPSTVFSILMTIIDKRKVSRDYIAERFSISKRTVSRYLNVLTDAGIPILSAPGRNGGIMLPDDYTLDKAFLSEAESLRLKDALERTAQQYSDKVNASLIEKLESVDKSRDRDTYVIKQDALYIDCDFEQAKLIRPRIRVFAEAIEQCRAVEVKYTDAHGYVSYRTIEPYTIVFKENLWYVYAMCRLRGDFRLFRLSRISDLRKTSKRFTKCESKLIEKLELEYYNELYIDLELEFFPTPVIMESIVDWLGAKSVTERGTKYVAAAEVPMTDTLVKRLLSYGSSIKVLNPPELATQLKEEAEHMLSVYSDL